MRRHDRIERIILAEDLFERLRERAQSGSPLLPLTGVSIVVDPRLSPGQGVCVNQEGEVIAVIGGEGNDSRASG